MVMEVGGSTVRLLILPLNHRNGRQHSLGCSLCLSSLYYILVFDLCAVVKWAFDGRGMLLMPFAVVVGVGACLRL